MSEIAVLLMKNRLKLTYLVFFLTVNQAFAQDVFVDQRDNQEYSTVIISGTMWMRENLNFNTELSLPSGPQQEINPNLRGRYYHLEEFCCVCPEGWRLPGVEDWLNYFSFMLKSVDSLAPLKFMGMENHFAIDGYSDKLDLFGSDNPLKLTGTGRVEGGKYKIPEDYADYWTEDPPEWAHELPPSKLGHTHVLNIVYDGKTHIHIRNHSFTNIHSHEHNLNPNREKKLRMFMVRCVKSVD